MDGFLVAWFAVSLVFLGIAAWFYPHCARPGLAAARSRRIGYRIVLAATIVAGPSFLARGIDVLVAFPRPIDDLLDLVPYLATLEAIPMLAYLRPAWIVRLTGGPEHAEQPR